ncbi:sporulation protein YqfD [Clostridium luticellarii]|jgi:similar to stage IV sporulation protein|uniref:sporulation protein YqfD n=1 Tax=Clostridium luticellarii TaxID=1691940 RepID=UPI002356603A|nr:sporulation protein YqfD [Clostridium luticellarii]MCI1944104.1 sporulation protein YqfD [Clostridium luticellarii]MCI1967254.1 sporulation protein YqfD [Clostridium luticellarii]MCI1995165.1 sporulation protein YqfD [Clostridium luticellarii]MCI2039339.1 sporulation protein YqfD [Clostridium luticellarii]
MRETDRSIFRKYRNGVILIEIQSLIPEKFINLMWKNDICIKNIKKRSITTMTMEINLKDYDKVENIARRTETRIKIIKRKGITFLIIKLKRKMTLAAGVILFAAIIYYLSTFIWSVKIESDEGVPPYIIRQELKAYGVGPGTSKSKIDVYKIEQDLMKDNEDIMWAKVRLQGSELNINAVEKKSPPDIAKDNTVCNLVAKKDGRVLRVYTTLGTPVVKIGDEVKKGQLLVKGEQGHEGSTYSVHATGYVICSTLYEDSTSVKIDDVKNIRTGKKINNYYINFGGQKLYLKKDNNKFDKYDKIEESKFIFGRETYFEVKKTVVKGDAQTIVKNTGEKLYKNICSNLDKSIKIVDKVITYEPGQSSYKVKVQVKAEENIAVSDEVVNKGQQ